MLANPYVFVGTLVQDKWRLTTIKELTSTEFTVSEGAASHMPGRTREHYNTRSAPSREV